MPEGDTIYKVAHYMAPRMTGKKVVFIEALGRRLPQMTAQTVHRVIAHGKHLLVDCSRTHPYDTTARSGWVLRVHLGMHGSWHVYPSGAAFKKPKHRATVIIMLADDMQYVCFDAEDVDLMEAEGLAPGPAPLGRLGPDLLADTPLWQSMWTRAKRLPPQTLLMDLLLNQRVAAGLGNVYKSELLFLHGLPVTTCLEDIDKTLLVMLWQRGSRLLRQNLGGWRRTTTCDRSHLHKHTALKQPRLWVYSRENSPCLVCRSPLSKARLGRKQRDTFWCAHCQRSLRELEFHKAGLHPAIVDAFLPA